VTRRFPSSARELVATAAEHGFKLIGTTGKSHLRFAKPGVRGIIVTSATPRNSAAACKHLRRDIERLLGSRPSNYQQEQSR
jgi:hypothetical protein